MSSIIQNKSPSLAQVPTSLPAPQIGDLLISYLEQIGVEYVFGIPGGAIEPLYNAMARSARRGGLRPIVARHETGAAFMADGYTRETGKLGVCCATTGPGATNLITGVASAYADNIPMLVITAQTALHTFGKGAVQDSSCTGVNTLGMFEHCTRYNSLVSHAEQFEGKLIAAIMTAFDLPRGPAHLSIPVDILRGLIPRCDRLFPLDRLLRQTSLLDDEIIDDVYECIRDAKNVVFLIGGGCSEAIGRIIEVAQFINASIVTTPQGKGLVSAYHPQFRGVFGFAGHKSAQNLLLDPETELVIAIGTGLGEWDSSGWDEDTILNERLIHIDSCVENLARSPMARLHVYGRISSLFGMLIKRFYSSCVTTVYPIADANQAGDRGKHRDDVDGSSIGGDNVVALEPICHFTLNDSSKYRDDSAPIKPQRLMRELAHMFRPNTRFLADSGNSYIWAIHYLHPIDRRITGVRSPTAGVVRTGMGFSSMGWAIGAAIGTAIGCRGNPVVCVTGDGSLLMSGQEITVAVQEQLPVVFVVLNDSALGMVKHGQQLAGAEPVGYGLPPVDLCMLAKALGAHAYPIHSPQDMADLDIDAMCKRHGPTLLDVYVDPDEVPPMGERVKTLNAAI